MVEILKEGDGTERRRSLGGSVKYENATDGSEEVSMGVEWSGVSTRHHQEWPQPAARGMGLPGSGLSPCDLLWHSCLPPFVPCTLSSPLSWREPASKGVSGSGFWYIGQITLTKGSCFQGTARAW